MAYYVVITGSRSITHSENVPLLIDSLIKRGVDIVVGDAPGVDRLVVAEAIKRGYGQHVTVVGAHGQCRNKFAIGKVGKIIGLRSTRMRPQLTERSDVSCFGRIRPLTFLDIFRVLKNVKGLIRRRPCGL